MKGRTVLSSGRYPLYQRLQYQHFDINTRLNVRQRTHDRASLHKAIRPITSIPPKYFRFSREEKFISSEERKISSEESVLFLKKVHSWEGITETVHGSFLLVL